MTTICYCLALSNSLNDCSPQFLYLQNGHKSTDLGSIKCLAWCLIHDEHLGAVIIADFKFVFSVHNTCCGFFCLVGHLLMFAEEKVMGQIPPTPVPPSTPMGCQGGAVGVQTPILAHLCGFLKQIAHFFLFGVSPIPQED